jgi:hypothetical protein
VPTPTDRAAAPARLALAALLSLLSGGGCGANPRAAAVDPPRARETLRATLDRWKSGETIAALKNASPPVVAQDFDWMAGRRLVAYEITGDGKDDDANLRIPVTLTLRTDRGKEVTKRVSYVVGTSPTLTVFREMN